MLISEILVGGGLDSPDVCGEVNETALINAAN